jgi:hypothetical protein
VWTIAFSSYVRLLFLDEEAAESLEVLRRPPCICRVLNVNCPQHGDGATK